MLEQDKQKTTQDTDHRSGPLDGLLIADFSRVLAGPYCTMLLGDLGATVIKLESLAGDDTRTWMPSERNGVATYYLTINPNTRYFRHPWTGEERFSQSPWTNTLNLDHA